MNTITMRPVEGSSLLAADGWDANLTTLRVRYHNGQEFEFRGLDPGAYMRYENAPSKGKYLKNQIEPNIRGVKVE